MAEGRRRRRAGDPIEWRRGEFSVSTNPALLDVGLIHRFLSEAYWSAGIPREVLEAAIAGSIPFGLYRGAEQIGFARVISDRATFAYVADVFVLASRRGAGLGTWLLECILEHPDLQGLRRWLLVTRDAQGLYRRVGFTELAEPARLMELVDPDVYRLRPSRPAPLPRAPTGRQRRPV
jgi:ribosomal protein S18 acetylase RimI-like enzyme